MKKTTKNSLLVIDDEAASHRIKVMNRRGFEYQLRREWGRSVREKQPISIMLVDVDWFKKYNDTYGHQQGDVALSEVAEVILRSLGRSTDYTARWGGEEFVILLPNTGLAGALDVAERIRSDTENLVIPAMDGKETKITVSIGVCAATPAQGDDTDAFVNAAEKSLYAAKYTGRNRVCHH